MISKKVSLRSNAMMYVTVFQLLKKRFKNQTKGRKNYCAFTSSIKKIIIEESEYH